MAHSLLRVIFTGWRRVKPLPWLCRTCFCYPCLCLSDEPGVTTHRRGTKLTVVLPAKSCRVCGQSKPIADFHKQKGGKYGVRTICKLCIPARDPKYMADYQRRARTADPERHRQKQRESYHRNHATSLSRAALRRARKRDLFIEKVDPLIVSERDGWICQICYGEVDRTITGRHRDARSMDHIIALANGGDHSYSNIQLAHFGCNSRKKAA